METSTRARHALAAPIVVGEIALARDAIAKEEVARASGSKAMPALAMLANETYSSVELAAAGAARAWRGRSAHEDREYMGALLALAEGGFGYSAAGGVSGADAVSVRVRIPRGARLAGLWHTHGAPHFSREFFSAIDTALAERLDAPLFLAAPSGALRVFAPGDAKLDAREAARLGLGASRGYARGRELRCDPALQRRHTAALGDHPLGGPVGGPDRAVLELRRRRLTVSSAALNGCGQRESTTGANYPATSAGSDFVRRRRCFGLQREQAPLAEQRRRASSHVRA